MGIRSGAFKANSQNPQRFLMGFPTARYFCFLIIFGALAISAGIFGYFFWGGSFEGNEIVFENISPEIIEKPITLLFVGDIMLSRSVAKQMEKYGDYRYPFLKIAGLTRSADLTFGNLEGPISAGGLNQGSIYSFRAKPEVVEGLMLAGFDVLSLANNHIWDWGSEALSDTIDILKKNGIEPVGAGKNYLEANSPAIKETSGTKIAFFAYTNLYPESLEAGFDSLGISSFNLEEIKGKISQMKKSGEADIVVVSLHWGEEYKREANRYQRDTAESLAESGADLIIGHHPHVIQEIENGIAYSLGNFVFDQSFSEETMEGAVLKVVIKDKKISEIIPLKIKINDTFQPEEISL
jgi:poly-gamma-glutamate synthesis protein (capsule biosynthesis protein)